MEERGRTAFWLVTAGAGVLLLLQLGSMPLLDPDEARFARTSVEMLRTGNYVVPTFEGKPRLVKPPLLHWVQATLFRYLGSTELAARLPSALATLGSLLLVAWAARRRFGEEAAAWAAAFFITMPLVWVEGRAATLDALLSVHILAALALDLAGPTARSGSRGAAIGALLGLAFLVKGPVGVALPLVVLLAGRTASGQELLPSFRTAASGVAAWFVVVLPWGLVFLQSVGSGTAAETVRHEALERYFAGTAHIEPPWYYGKVLVVGCLPWVGPLLAGAVALVRKRNDQGAKTAVYCAAGLLAGVVFFSIGKGKLPNYLLPLAPLVALIVTWQLGQELWAPRKNRAGSVLLTVTMAALALVLGGAAVKGVETRAATMIVAGAVAYGLGALAALFGVLRDRPRLAYGAAALAMAAFFSAAIVGLPRILAEKRSAAPLVRQVPALATGRPIVVVERELPSLTFYLDRIPEKRSAGELIARQGRGDGALYVVDETDLASLPLDARNRFREVGSAGRLHVFEEVTPDR